MEFNDSMRNLCRYHSIIITTVKHLYIEIETRRAGSITARNNLHRGEDGVDTARSRFHRITGIPEDAVSSVGNFAGAESQFDGLEQKMITISDYKWVDAA